MTITSKTILDVAFVRAIFSVVIAIGSEGFSAAGAGVGVDGGRPSVYSLRMMVPPVLTAFVRAEEDLFSLRDLLDWLAAVLAEGASSCFISGCSWSFCGELVPAAVGAHLVLGKTEQLCYLAIAFTGAAKLCDVYSLFVRHLYHLQ